ncbi:MAG: hypothetical protein AB1730_15015 [Myxococcota bacterium]
MQSKVAVAVAWIAAVSAVSCGQQPVGSNCTAVCSAGLVCDEASGRCVVDSSSSGGGTGGGSQAAGDLPCEVAQVLDDACLSCHGAALSGGATVRLVTRADLAAPSYVDASQSLAQRSVVRMRQSTGAMPPAPQAPVAANRIAAFEAWVNAGLPAGSCQASTDAGAGGGSGGGGGTVAPPPYDGGVAGLPCDVAAFVASKCASCHRSPPTGGATFPLLGRADFLAPSPTYAGWNLGQRSSARLHDTAMPMPPTYSPQPTAAELATFDGWISSGMPEGACGAVDAGVPDAGPAPTTCSTNSFWTSGDHGSGDMNPGLACKTCHASKAFFKQYPFSGTVYPSLHEQDRCNARPPTGTKIEILDKNGNVALTMTPSGTSGNFHSSLLVSVAMPYTARLTANGRTSTMTTPQTNGDCNTCHTEQGKNGALGRIVWP